MSITNSAEKIRELRYRNRMLVDCGCGWGDYCWEGNDLSCMWNRMWLSWWVFNYESSAKDCPRTLPADIDKWGAEYWAQ